jgi:hypothetical protein
MTEAGRAVLPDLSPASFQVPPDILEALQADPTTWTNFQGFPETYQRIRVGYVEGARRRPAEFQKRLANLLKKTRENKQFGSPE